MIKLWHLRIIRIDILVQITTRSQLVFLSTNHEIDRTSIFPDLHKIYTVLISVHRARYESEQFHGNTHKLKSL